MKSSNILLIVILLLLAGIVAYMFMGDSSKNKRTFRSSLVEIDTSKVTIIKLLNPKEGKKMSLEKTDGQWWVKNDTFKELADPSKIAGLLTGILSIKPKSLTSKNKSTWTEYQVDAEQATQLVIEEHGTTSLDLMIGKFDLKQPPVPAAAPQGGQQMPPQQARPMPFSYVRLAEETEVYTVDGMLGMALNRQPTDFLLPPPVETETADSISIE